jgi:hypothetical protein
VEALRKMTVVDLFTEHHTRFGSIVAPHPADDFVE